MKHGTAMERVAREYGTAVGLGAALFALVQVLAAASAAHENSTAVVILERSLVDLANGGGAVVTPAVSQLARVWVLMYLLALAALAAGLVLAWHAGRMAALTTGSPAAGALAGRWVMVCGSAVWVVAAALAFVVLRLDATFSWVAAIVAAILLAPNSPPRGTLYTVTPTLTYIVFQLLVLLLHAVFGVLLALALGSVAGRRGGRAALTAHATPPRAV